FDKMNVSLLNGSIDLENIQLDPDTAIYFKTYSPKSSDDLFQIRAASLNISGLKVLKLIFNKTMQLSTLTLNSPDFIVMNMVDTIKVDSNAKKSLYEKIPTLFKGAKLGLLKINDLSFVQQVKGDTTKRGVKWSGLN